MSCRLFAILKQSQLISGGVRTGVDLDMDIFCYRLEKKHGYVGADDSYYRRPGSEGRTSGRKVFLLLVMSLWETPIKQQVQVLGRNHRNCDSIAITPRNISTLGNDEYTIFDQDYQRIRYIIDSLEANKDTSNIAYKRYLHKCVLTCNASAHNECVHLVGSLITKTASMSENKRATP